jgi:two-component system, NarL family, response regulator DevR
VGLLERRASVRTIANPAPEPPSLLSVIGPIPYLGPNVPPVLRVFLVDDHELLRVGVRTELETEADLIVAGEAGTAAEALAGVAAVHPDVVIVDVQLAQGNGIELCRELRSRHPGVRCLILSAFCDVRDVSAAFLAGASGYLLKQRPAKDLIEAIREVAEGKTVLDPVLADTALPEVSAGITPDPLLVQLSGQERQILELIAGGHTNREIGDRLFLAEKTVRNYVSHLLAKLGMHRRSEAAAYAARLAERGGLTGTGR